MIKKFENIVNLQKHQLGNQKDWRMGLRMVQIFSNVKTISNGAVRKPSLILTMMLMTSLIAAPFTISYADNSRVIGNVNSTVTGGLITNIAAGVGTEAMTGSVVLESSELHGNVTSSVEGLLTVINTAIGVNAYADLGTVNLKNAVVKGDINISVKGISLINVAIGNNTRAGIGSVVAR